jgi:hypothetical protein
MTGRETDIFQVVVFSSRPDGFLGACRPGVTPVFQAEKTVFKLDHA